MPTTQALLNDVRTAIQKVLRGGVSEFRDGGGDGARMLSLRELQAMESKYEAQLAAESGQSSRFRPVQRTNL